MSSSFSIASVQRIETVALRSHHQLDQVRFLDTHLIASDKDRLSVHLFFVDIEPPEPRLLLFRRVGTENLPQPPRPWMIPNSKLQVSKNIVRESLLQLCAEIFPIEHDTVLKFFKPLELLDDEGELWDMSEHGRPITLNHLIWCMTPVLAVSKPDWKDGLYERRWIVERDIETLDDFYPDHLSDRELEGQSKKPSKEDLQAFRDTVRAVFERAWLYTRELSEVYAETGTI